MSLQGLSEDADGDGWVTKLRGKSIPVSGCLKFPINLDRYK